MIEPLGLDADRLQAEPLLLPLRRYPQAFDASFRRFNRRSLIMISAVTLLVALALYAALNRRVASDYVEVGWLVTTLLLLGGFLAVIPLDIACLSVSATRLSDASRAGEWDLLTLANYPPDRIIDAFYLRALARVWKLLAVVSNLRIAAGLCLMVWLGVLVAGLGAIFFIPVALLFTSAYIYEPRWRVRALIGTAILTSSLVRQPTMAILGSVAAIFAVWFAQGLAMGLLYWLARNFTNVDDPVLICLSAYLLFVVAGYYAYRRVTTVALRKAADRMTCCADDLR